MGGSLTVLDGDNQHRLLDGVGAADTAYVLARMGGGDLWDTKASARDLPRRGKLPTRRNGAPVGIWLSRWPSFPREELGRVKGARITTLTRVR